MATDELSDAEMRTLGVKATGLALVGDRIYARRAGRWALLDNRSYATIGELVGHDNGRARATLGGSDGSAKS